MTETKTKKVLLASITTALFVAWGLIVYQGMQPPGPYDPPSEFDGGGLACIEVVLPLLDSGPQYRTVFEVFEDHEDWPNGWAYALYWGQFSEREGLDDPDYKARSECNRWGAGVEFPDFRNGEIWSDIE